MTQLNQTLRYACPNESRPTKTRIFNSAAPKLRFPHWYPIQRHLGVSTVTYRMGDLS
jgi:hypothetical protein